MALFTLKGNPQNTNGDLPAVGSRAPIFKLVKNDLSELDSAELRGKKIVLNIFPSLDTPTCAASVRRFNQEASSLENTMVVCVSRDLPFAQARFCGSEGLDNVVTASDFRGSFAPDYGVEIQGGPLGNLTARAVVVVDETGTVTHSDLVGELAEEPDYEAVLVALG